MIEDVRKRIEKAVEDAIQDMYTTHLRKMQSDMHLCAVNCCDDRKSLPQIDNVQSCIEDCAAPLLRAQDYIQHELREFQTSLQRCVMVGNETDFFLNSLSLSKLILKIVSIFSNAMKMFAVKYR